MERHVKERLVGAAVLMAAAVILIPEMLSGPERAAPPAAAPAAHDTTLKTYTIDLQQPQGSAAPVPLEERAPPPETPAPAEPAGEPRSEPQANPQSQTPSATATTADQQTSRSVEPASANAPPPPKPTPPQTSASTPAQSAVKAGAWAVQIGSFSRQASAERLAGELKSEGHAAFVMPIRSGGNTLYRVRVGPMSDRAAADAALRNLKVKAPGATIVAHP